MCSSANNVNKPLTCMNNVEVVDKRTSDLNDYLSSQQICVARTARARFLGLMGKRNYKGVLVLMPCNDIHTFFMKMNIDVAFIGLDGDVLSVAQDVEPKHRLKCKNAIVVMERQSCSDPWFCVGDVICLDCLGLDCANPP